jgi:hypothetical protein
MAKTQIVNSTRTFAAIRAQRTMVAKLLNRTVNEIARAGLRAALVQYDAELVNAPAATSVKTPRTAADRHLSAIRAHRTMLVTKMAGTRGKVRTEMKAKIAGYDQLLAASA